MNQSPSPQNTPPEFERGTPQQGAGAPQMVPVKLPSTKPYVTYGLIAVTVVVFLFQLLTSYMFGYDLLTLYGAKVNSLIVEGQFWRLITPMFLHGDILHIAFNMYALYIIGPRIERYYGHQRFLGLYFLSGFGGNVISMMFTDAPSLGASTATFGLLGAHGIFFYHNRKTYGPAVRQALNGIVTVLVINLIIGLSARIDNWGHVGGLIGGMVFAWLGGPIMGIEGISPEYSLKDQRSPRDVIQAFLVTSIFFVILTIGAIYLRT